MKVSAVSCTYNRDLQMRRGLLSMLNQSLTVDELVLVDDGSSDNTQEYAEDLKKTCFKRHIEFKYVYLDHPEPRISCIPRNIGVHNSTGEVIIFTEPEALHVDNTIDQLLTKMRENPDKVILASQVWTMGRRIQEKLDEESFIYPARILSHPYAMLVEGNMHNTNAPDADFAITGESHCNAGVLFACRKKWLEDVGGFDESFEGHGGDDFDIINRLGYNGHPLLKCPDIIVIHQYHEKNYPYNIYEMAEKNLKKSEANIKAGRFKVND